MRSNNIEELFQSIGFYPVEISAERCVDETPLVAVRGHFKAQKAKKSIPNPSRILKSGNRTIVFWNDGTKTIVKRAEDEQDNDYAAFTAALGIKLYGSNSALKRIVERTETQKQKGETVIEFPTTAYKAFANVARAASKALYRLGDNIAEKEQKEDDPNG